jgi:hypothetical protein
LERKMSLQEWLKNGWLRPHKTSRNEIANLLAIVERDMKDAQGDISADWRFGIAYNAALKLCTALLYASGYQAEKTLQHYRTLQALSLILGDKWKPESDYLDKCRTKRNTVEYDSVGDASDADAHELLDFVGDFRLAVTDWLKEKHPDLIAGGRGRQGGVVMATRQKTTVSVDSLSRKITATKC